MSYQSLCEKKMKTFLNDYYTIPDYQRDYAWEYEQLDDFITDLDSVRKEGYDTHGFGAIIIHNDNADNKKYVVDGQQRCVTSIIFLRCLQLAYLNLYNEYDNLNAKEKADDISIIAIGRRDDMHLTLQSADADYFYNEIEIGIPTHKPTKPSQKCIYNAFNYFKKVIDDELKSRIGCDSKKDYLDSLYNTFMLKFDIIEIGASTFEEAYTLFETTNARGKSLTPGDLIKNTIFKKSKEDACVVQEKWSSMYSILQDANADYTKYIRSVYISQYGYVASKKLFSEVNKTVLSDMSIDDFMDILCENVEVYSSLVSPKEYNYFNDKSIQDMLIVLRHNLNVTTYYPIMITMVRKNFDIASIRDILYKIICLYVRNNAICQKHSTLYEKMFSDLSVKIYNNTITSMQEINKIISQYMVDDDEFFLSFCNWTACGKNKIAVVRYLLTAIHKYLDNGLELNLNNSEVHVEHIMPKTLSPSWDISKEEHDENLWRLGNLMLLSGLSNVKISNGSFEIKKEAYRISKIEPNQDICKYSSWNKESIAQRQHKLAEYALKIWYK